MFTTVPVIDNSVSAFVGQDLFIYFYVDSTKNEITKYVLVDVRVYNDSVLTVDGMQGQPVFLECYGVEGEPDRRYVKLPSNQHTTFDINKPIKIKMAFVSDDVNVELIKKSQDWQSKNCGAGELCSQWSNTVIKFYLSDFTFNFYGGVPADNLSPSFSNLDYKLHEDFAAQTLNQNNEGYNVIGKLTWNDSLEYDTIQWYEIQIYDPGDQLAQHNILFSTDGRNYPNRVSWDTTGLSFSYTFDTLSVSNEVESLCLAVAIGTTKGFVQTYIYQLNINTTGTIFEDDNTIVDAWGLSCTPYSSNSCIQCTFFPLFFSSYTQQDTVLGTLTIERAVYSSSPIWHTIKAIENQYFINKEKINYLDFSAEAGILYDYRVTFRREEGNTTYESTSSVVFTTLVIEDIFLVTPTEIVKIAYNPSVTNFKRNIAISISPTLGGQYPFIRQAGKQDYRSFSFGGLISYRAHEGSGNETTRDSQNKYHFIYDDDYDDSLFIKVNTTRISELLELTQYSRFDKELIIEKLFRNEIIDFLYKNQIILYKSLTEGNIFIRLSDITFTPEAQLGRGIYSFSATATEVMEANSTNYMNYFEGTDTANEKTYNLTSTWSAFSHIYFSSGTEIDKSFNDETTATSDLINKQALNVSSLNYNSQEDPETITIDSLEDETIIYQNSAPYLGVAQFSTSSYNVAITEDEYSTLSDEEKASFTKTTTADGNTVYVKSNYETVISDSTIMPSTSEATAEKQVETEQTISTDELVLNQDTLVFGA